uniref:Uncharacterized protein n=1 Tax=Triticum urartu TaxID=4572 RepID=A0A8R7P4Z3_TRIUA
MASAELGKKLRILIIPLFVTSHIGPHTDLAVRLAAARGTVEPTLAVTPANVSVVRSTLQRHGASAATSAIKIATYPFPEVDGLPLGVENLSAAGAAGWRIFTRPAQEALIRELPPDAVLTDVHFFRNSVIAGDLGVPCIAFSVIDTFSNLAMSHLGGKVDCDSGCKEVIVPRFPGPEVRIPRTKLPEFLRVQEEHDRFNPRLAGIRRCFGAFNTFLDMERQY